MSRKGCARGIRKAFQTKGVDRFRCESCDYDMCDWCFMRELGRQRKSLTASFSKTSLSTKTSRRLSGSRKSNASKKRVRRSNARRVCLKEDLSSAIRTMEKIVNSYLELQQKNAQTM
ncbi:hypothetical protein MHBO_000290 [Bonamia ostreae]|uniref:ZZ-type domain-containing protein n=1 Tax=Bonamia ostreae TaxID=126728 RepID=A0ABV2AF41_9EUKA